MVGTTLGHYRIVRKLGSGGMGDVYVGLDEKLGREVALKVLPAEFARDPERRSRFEREARAAAALNHPSIVTIHSVEEAGGEIFITMELVEGETLASLLSAGPLALGRVLDIGVPLVEAMAAAHERGIVHRDLKPQNVIVTRDGVAKILDFGLAKFARAGADDGVSSDMPTASLTTSVGHILGTPAYMSPEQAEGKGVDQRTDIFSFGIVLYEMAAGQRPFQGDSAMGIISAVIKDTPPGLGELRPDLPPELARIVARCLVKEPSGRYPSARALAEELAALRAAPRPAPGATLTDVRPAAPAELAPAPAAAVAAPSSWSASFPRLQQRWGVVAPVLARLLQIDPSIEPTVAPEKRKSVPVAAVLALLLPGVGLIYAAPVLTALMVLICGAIAAGLLGEVPLVGGVLSGLAWVVFALVSSVLGGSYAWHYNRHGKRTPLRAVRYGK